MTRLDAFGHKMKQKKTEFRISRSTSDFFKKVFPWTIFVGFLDRLHGPKAPWHSMNGGRAKAAHPARWPSGRRHWRRPNFSNWPRSGPSAHRRRCVCRCAYRCCARRPGGSACFAAAARPHRLVIRQTRRWRASCAKAAVRAPARSQGGPRPVAPPLKPRSSSPPSLFSKRSAGWPAKWSGRRRAG